MTKSFRSEFEREIDILKVIEGGPQNLNTVIRLANVWYTRIRELLEDMEKKGWLAYRSGRPTQITITAKGLKVLKLWRDIQNA